MSVTLTIIEDPFNVENWKTIEVESLLDSLVAQFGKWPVHARLYKEIVSEATEVTPHDEFEIEQLKEAEGHYFVVNYPGFGVDTLLYIALAASVVAAFVLKPKIPNQTERSRSSKSPNNSLSARTNDARPNGRIPDIFGTVRSTPDLIALPYTEFVDSVEVENALMCIGRGQYEIHDCRDGTTAIQEIDGATVNIWKPYQDIRAVPPYYQSGPWITEPVIFLYRNDAVNGQTLKATVQQIVKGEGDIQFYSPNGIRINHLGPTSWKTFSGVFNPGQQVTIINARRDDELLYLRRQGAVTLPNVKANSLEFEVTDGTMPTWINIGDKLRIISPPYRGTILNGGIFDVSMDLAGEYTVTDLEIRSLPGPPIFYYLIVTLANPQDVAVDWFKVPYLIQNQYDEVVHDINDAAKIYDLAGTYTVEAIGGAGKEMTLVNPSAVNPDWALVGSSEPWMSPTVFNLDSFAWIGEFTANDPNTTEILVNFVAPNGAYGDNGNLIFPLFIQCYLEYWPVNASGAQIGPSVRAAAIVGKNEFDSTDQRGTTLRLTGLPPSRYKVRAARETPKLDGGSGDFQFVDEIKWKDFYYGTVNANNNFGNLTIVRSRTVATEGALSLKERRLNALVTRQINLRVSGNTFTPDLYSTRRADEILSFVALDPKLGNRPIDELDVDNIYTTILQGQDYFGFSAPLEFCYTFDDELSFEESWLVIAQAVFCVAYRQGSLLKIKFEGRTEDSTLLFNHRNKIPGSETRTYTFGPSDEFDGVAYQWVSPDDDAIVTRYIPEDRSAKNEKRIESVGVRNEYQSYIHAWRNYQKIIYQNTVTNFQATEESELLVTTDRILVADNTRPDTQDGEVINTAGLLIETSQKVAFQPGKNYTIFLQMYDGTVQSLPCFEVVGDEYAVAINTAPRNPLVFTDDRYAKTVYTIVANDDPRQTAFLLTDRETGDNGVSDVTAVNYDARYYAHDNDLFPPIDRTLYLSSRPYESTFSDAFVPSVGVTIRNPPDINYSEKTDRAITIDSIALIEQTPAVINYSEKTDRAITIESIYLADQPALQVKEAFDPAGRIAIALPNTIFYENNKDAFIPTAKVVIQLS
jgi:hypothetical protein